MHSKVIPTLQVLPFSKISIQLVQGSANYFCKRPNNKYFWLSRPQSLLLNQHRSSHTQMDRLCSNKALVTTTGSKPDLTPILFASPRSQVWRKRGSMEDSAGVHGRDPEGVHISSINSTISQNFVTWSPTQQGFSCLCLKQNKKKQIWFGKHTHPFPLSNGKKTVCEQMIENDITNILVYLCLENYILLILGDERA